MRHNREPLRRPEYVQTVQAENQAKVLGAIAQLKADGKPFTKADAIAEAGLYVRGKAEGYINDRPALLAAFNAAQPMGVSV